MKKWLKRKSVADKLDVSYNFLRTELEPSEGFPKPITLSPRVSVYEESQIEEWMTLKESQLQSQPANT